LTFTLISKTAASLWDGDYPALQYTNAWWAKG